MGTMLEESFDISKLKHSLASDFIAEVFFEELQYILGRDLNDMLIVSNHGMNSRVESKDVVDIETQYISTRTTYKEYLVLHLGRNSIYHELPESFFYPLTISTPSTSNRELVETIRENRKREKFNVDFFSLFDTELFKQKVRINNRHLNFLSDEKAKENLLRIAENILDVSLSISKQGWYKLFLNLCNAEFFKENLNELEELINIVLGLNVQIRYIEKELDEIPFLSLGKSKLGVDSGLCGSVQSEIDDIETTIILDQQIDNYDELLKNINNIRTILQFFVLSSRETHFKYEVKSNTSFCLGDNHLGYDSYL